MSHGNDPQAYQMRPAIIFFDEIDGLAPVRSSRQDQIHRWAAVGIILLLMNMENNTGNKDTFNLYFH